MAKCSIILNSSQSALLTNELLFSEFSDLLYDYYQGLGSAPDISLLVRHVNDKIVPGFFDNYTLQDLIDFLEDGTNQGRVMGGIGNLIAVNRESNLKNLTDPEYIKRQSRIIDLLIDDAYAKLDANTTGIEEQAQEAETIDSSSEGLTPVAQTPWFETQYTDLNAYTDDRFKSSGVTELMMRAKFVNDVFLKSVYIDTDNRRIVSKLQVPGQPSEIDHNLKRKRVELLNSLVGRLDLHHTFNGEVKPITFSEALLEPSAFRDLLRTIEDKVVNPKYKGESLALNADGVLFRITNEYKLTNDRELKQIIDNYIDYVIVADFNKLLDYYIPGSISINKQNDDFDFNVRKYSTKNVLSADAVNAAWEEKVQNGIDLAADLFKLVINTTPLMSHITGKPTGETIYPPLISDVFSKYYDKLDFQDSLNSIRTLLLDGLNDRSNSLTHKNVLYTLYKKFFELDSDKKVFHDKNKNTDVTSWLATVEASGEQALHPFMLLIVKPLEEIVKVKYAEAMEIRRQPSINEISTKSNTSTLTHVRREVMRNVNKSEEDLKAFIDKYSVKFTSGDVRYKSPNGNTVYTLKEGANAYDTATIIEMSNDLLGVDFIENRSHQEFKQELESAAKGDESFPNSYLMFMYDALRAVEVKSLLYDKSVQEDIQSNEGAKVTNERLRDLINKELVSTRDPASTNIQLTSAVSQDIFELLAESENRYTGNRLKSTVTTLEGTTVAGFSVYNYFLGFQNNVNKIIQHKNSVAGVADNRFVLSQNPFINDTTLHKGFYIRGAVKIGDQVKSNSAQNHAETMFYDINLAYFDQIGKAVLDGRDVQPIFDPTTYSDKTTNFLPIVGNVYNAPGAGKINLFVDSNGNAVAEDTTLKLHYKAQSAYYKAYANNILDTWKAIYAEVKKDNPGLIADEIFSEDVTLSDQLRTLNFINEGENKSGVWYKEGHPYGLKGYAAARYYADKAGVHLTNWVHFQNNSKIIDNPPLTLKGDFVNYVSLFDGINNMTPFKQRLDKVMMKSVQELIDIEFVFSPNAVTAIQQMYPGSKMPAKFKGNGGVIFLTAGGVKPKTIDDINPAYRKFFYDWNFVSESLMNATLGSIYAHKGGNENGMWTTQTKRNVAAPASIRRYTLGLDNGVEDETNVAFVDDIISKLFTIHGEGHTVVDLDGASFSTVTQRIKTWNSLNGEFNGDGGPDHKSFTTHFDPATGEVGINKHADFMMNYELIRNSIGSDVDLMELHKDLYRTDISKVDITRSWKDSVNLSNFSDLYYWKRAYNFDNDTAGDIIKIDGIQFTGKDAFGRSQYEIKETNLTTGETLEPRAIEINTMYDLWIALGGIDSVNVSDAKTAVSYKNGNNTVYMTPSVSSAYKLLDFECYMGDPSEYYVPENYIVAKNKKDVASYNIYKQLFNTKGVVNSHIDLIDSILQGKEITDFDLHAFDVKVRSEEFTRIVKANASALTTFFNNIRVKNGDGLVFRGKNRKYQRFKGQNIERITTAGAQKLGQFNMNDSSTFSKSRREKALSNLKLADQIKPNVVPENISSKGSEFAKRLTNVGNNVGITYKGKAYVNAEHAYQTWKSGQYDQKGYDLAGGKVRGGKIGDTFAIMTDILTEKLKQHPDLVDGIVQRGGLEYLKQSTHNVIGDKFWESTGQNKFMEALQKAFETVYEEPVLEHRIPGITKLLYHPISNLNSGIQLSAWHETENSTVTAPTQMLNALVFRGRSLEEVNAIYDAIANIVDEGLMYEFESGAGGKYNIPQIVKGLSNDEMYSQYKNQLLAIFKDLMKRKVDRDEEFTLEKLILETFEAADLPIDDPHMFNSAIAELANYFTKRGIKINFDGMFAVLTPGSGMMQVRDVEGGYLPVKTADGLAYKKLTSPVTLLGEEYEQWKALNDHIAATGDERFEKTETKVGEARDLKGQQVMLEFADGSKKELSILRKGDTHSIPEAQALVSAKDMIDDFKSLGKEYGALTPEEKLAQIDDMYDVYKVSFIDALNRDKVMKYVVDKFADRMTTAGAIIPQDETFVDFLYDNLSTAKQARDEKLAKQLADGDMKGAVLTKEYEYFDKLNMVGKLFTFELQNFMKEASEGVIPHSLTTEHYADDITTATKVSISRAEVIAPIITKTAFLLRDGDVLSEIDERFFVNRLAEKLDYFKVKADAVAVGSQGKRIYIHEGIVPRGQGLVQSEKIVEINGKRFFTDISGNRLFLVPKGVFLAEVGGRIHVWLNKKIDLEVNIIKQLNDGFGRNGERFTVQYLGENAEEEYQKRLLTIADEAKEMYNSWMKYLDVIGTRIPGQHFQSFQGMRIVGFTEGNKVYVANEITLLSGSDFDIDKQNVIYYSVTGDGKLAMWHPAAKMDTVENLEASLQLPLPIKRQAEDFTAEMIGDVLLDPIADVSGFNPEDLASVVALYSQLDKGMKLHPQEHAEIIEELVRWDNAGVRSGMQGIKNFAISRTNKVIESPSNFLLLYKPAVMDVPKQYADNSAKAANAKTWVRENPVSVSLLKETNMTGKQVIGVMASQGLKTFSAITLVYNNTIRKVERLDYKLIQLDNTLATLDPVKDMSKITTLEAARKRIQDEIAYLSSGILGVANLANINLDNVSERVLSHIGIGASWTGDEVDRREGKYFDRHMNGVNVGNWELARIKNEFSEDAADLESQLLSAATDNAKELILSKINASADFAGIYAYQIMLNRSFEEIVDFMTSPTVEMLIRNAGKNIYNGVTSKNSISNLVDLMKRAEDTNPNNSNLARDAKEEIFDRYNLQLKQVKDAMYYQDDTTKELFRSSDVANYDIALKHAKLVQLIAKYLGINQGLKSNSWELYNFKTKIEDYVNKEIQAVDFDFKRFLDSVASDGEYHVQMVKEVENRLAENSPAPFNILFILAESKHFARQLVAYNAANTMLQLSSYRVNSAYSIVAKLRQMNFLSPTENINKNQFKELEEFVEGTVIDNFIQSEMEINNEDINTRPLFYDGEHPIPLNNKDGRDQFLDWVRDTFLKNVKNDSRFKGNAFIQDLTLGDRLDPLYNGKVEFMRLKQDTTNVKSYEQVNFRDSYLYNLGLIYKANTTDGQNPDEPMKNNNIFNVLFWYNLIVNKNNITKYSYAKLLGDLMLRERGTNPYKRLLELKGKLGKVDDVRLDEGYNKVISNGIDFDMYELLGRYEYGTIIVKPGDGNRNRYEEALDEMGGEDFSDAVEVDDVAADVADADDVALDADDDVMVDVDDQTDEEGNVKNPRLTVEKVRKIGEPGTTITFYLGSGSRKTELMPTQRVISPRMGIPHDSPFRSKRLFIESAPSIEANLDRSEQEAVNYQKFLNSTMHQLLSNLVGDIDIQIITQDDNGNDVYETFDPTKDYKCL